MKEKIPAFYTKIYRILFSWNLEYLLFRQKCVIHFSYYFAKSFLIWYTFVLRKQFFSLFLSLSVVCRSIKKFEQCLDGDTSAGLSNTRILRIFECQRGLLPSTEPTVYLSSRSLESEKYLNIGSRRCGLNATPRQREKKEHRLRRESDTHCYACIRNRLPMNRF